MHVDAVEKGQRVLVVDDLMATGGTAAAAMRLVTELGGDVIEAAFVIELTFLKGADKVGVPCFSLLKY